MLPDAPNNLRLRLTISIGLVVLVTIIGTVGYSWLGIDQGADWLDALYMTVITITTVGYGEVIKLDDRGRWFTMFIALTGIGSFFYGFSVIMENLLASRLLDPSQRRKMQHQIETLTNHVIIAGLGRVGKQAALELAESGVPFVVIDPRAELFGYAQQRRYLLISGDATDDEVLQSAGLRSASGLIVTTGDDANNLYIVLSARVLRSDLYIVSRAVDDSSIPKLMKAGANRAISPYAIGGRRLAHLILSPTVVDFFDTVIKRGEESLNLEDIKVTDDAAAAGKSIAELRLREVTGATVLVVLRDNKLLPNPDPELVLQPGDQLLALGTVEQLDRLELVIAG